MLSLQLAGLWAWPGWLVHLRKRCLLRCYCTFCHCPTSSFPCLGSKNPMFNQFGARFLPPRAGCLALMRQAALTSLFGCVKASCSFVVFSTCAVCFINWRAKPGAKLVWGALKRCYAPAETYCMQATDRRIPVDTDFKIFKREVRAFGALRRPSGALVQKGVFAPPLGSKLYGQALDPLDRNVLVHFFPGIQWFLTE